MPVIPAFGMMRQEDHCEFTASLGYMARSRLNKRKVKAVTGRKTEYLKLA